jgi:hypothetical protein
MSGMLNSVNSDATLRDLSTLLNVPPKPLTSPVCNSWLALNSYFSCRPSVPIATASGPPGSSVRSCDTLACKLSSVEFTLNAVPVKLAARICSTTAGVLGAKKFTVPLLSSGRILE